jgi:predicted NBD/HSP70 family sugar kinase
MDERPIRPDSRVGTVYAVDPPAGAATAPRTAAARIVSLLRERGPMTRAQLARLSGMPKSTISVVVADLSADGVVQDRGQVQGPQSGRGRPGTVVALDPASGAAIGVEFGFARVRVCLVDAAHQVVARADRPIGVLYAPETAVQVGAELVAEMVRGSPVDEQRIVGVGLSFPLVGMQVASLDAGGSAFSGSHMRPGWEGVDITALLGDALPYPVIADNDANCAARGEMLWGAGRNYRDVLFLKLHSGVGGALVLDGAVRPGRSGGAGEFGHMSLDTGGPLCRCGNRGCLEAYVGLPALLGALQPWFPEPLTLARVLDLLDERHPACTRAVMDAAHHIGQAVGALCNAVNPEAVILGGALSRAGDVLLQETRRAFTQTCLAINADVHVTLAELGSDAGALGAAALPLTAAPVG